MRRHGTKDGGHSVALIFMVFENRVAGRGWQWRTDLPGQLLAAFIQADQGPGWIRLSGIDFEHLLHRGHELGVGFGSNHPLLFLPRLELIFFSVWRTVSWLISPTISSSTKRSANNLSVQRSHPTGGPPQLSARSWASPLPSSRPA